MDQITLALGFGVVTAAILALSSVGLTLQFGVTNFINFAYGGYLILGAYISWTLTTLLGVDMWIAAVVASLAIGILSVLVSKGILAHFTKGGGRSLFYLLIVTFGLSLILQNVIQMIWGPDYLLYKLPSSSPLHIGPFLLTPQQLIIMGVTVALMVGLHLLLKYTKLGKAMRAMSDNAPLAMVSGINTNRVTTITWLLSGMLAGLAGSVFGYSLGSINPFSDASFLFVTFAAVIVGGIGKAYGAMIGAIVIGLTTELSAIVVTGAYKDDIAFVILVLVLLLRPQGIFATAGKA